MQNGVGAVERAKSRKEGAGEGGEGGRDVYLGGKGRF